MRSSTGARSSVCLLRGFGGLAVPAGSAGSLVYARQLGAHRCELLGRRLVAKDVGSGICCAADRVGQWGHGGRVDRPHSWAQVIDR